VAWTYDLGTARVQEATPVVIDGVMYTSGNLGRVYALDAASGRPLWTFEPPVDMQANRSACCDQANRGVAVAGGKVLVGTLDGWLYALDAKSGKVAWKVDTITDHTRGYTITARLKWRAIWPSSAMPGPNTTRAAMSPPMIWRAGGRSGGSSPSRTIPNWARRKPPSWSRPPRPGRPTAAGTSAVAVRHGTPSTMMRVSTPSSSASAMAAPTTSCAARRGGDNLYLSSLVAVDRKTGRVKWHYQETPGDAWDFTATQPMLFTDLEVNGQLRPVLIHAPKNGFLFVIDRETGKPLAINALVRTSWAKGYDAKTGRAQKTPAGSAYWEGPKIVFPASPGARNWYPAAYDPDRRLYTASVLDMGNLMFATPPLDKGDGRRPKALNVQTTMLFTSDLNATLPTLPKPMQDLVKTLPEWKWVQKQPYSSQLRALDPLTGKARWAVDMQGWQDRPGVLATKTGLIFHGTLGGQFVARDADTGKVLKSIDTGSSTLAAPMTYRVHGVQYLAVATGFGGGGWGYVPRYSAAYTYGNANRLLVFKLDGAPAKKPDPLPPLEVVPAPPPQAPALTPPLWRAGRRCFSPIARSATPTSRARPCRICGGWRPERMRSSTRSCWKACFCPPACRAGTMSSPPRMPMRSMPI
jgi:quinohemoprotein ethanol dehydrogenase